MRPLTEVISIRIKPELAGAIDKLRERYGNISRSEWVRNLITSYLYAEDRENVAGQLAELHELLEGHKEEFAALRKLGLRVTHLLLERLADLDRKEASELIHRRILRK